MRRHSTNYILVLIIADLLLTLGAWHLATLARHYLPYGVPLTLEQVQQPLSLYLTVALIWLTIFSLLSVYDARRTLRPLDEAFIVATAVATASLVFAGVLYLFFRDVPRRTFLYFAVFDLVLLLGVRWTLRLTWRALGRHKRETARVLIVGAGRVGREVAKRVQQQSWAGLDLVGYLDDDVRKHGQIYHDTPVLGSTHIAPAIVKEKEVEDVIFALPLRAHGSLEELVLALQELPVRTYVVPDYFDLAFFRASMEDFGGVPLIGLRDPAITGVQRVVKRVFDLTISSAALLFLWPLMLVIAVAIRWDSPGPALFRQLRVGENGRLFTIYKFRTMVVGADRQLEEMSRSTNFKSTPHKRPDDPRITRLGKILRRTSLDELPQLLNVLKGEMSLVGPRPEIPLLVQRYEAWQRKRFAVPPGITGWWQVNGRSDRVMHLHTEDDLYYIQHYSPLLDLRILWRTIGVVIRGKGAY